MNIIMTADTFSSAYCYQQCRRWTPKCVCILTYSQSIPAMNDLNCVTNIIDFFMNLFPTHTHQHLIYSPRVHELLFVVAPATASTITTAHWLSWTVDSLRSIQFKILFTYTYYIYYNIIYKYGWQERERDVYTHTHIYSLIQCVW